MQALSINNSVSDHITGFSLLIFFLFFFMVSSVLSCGLGSKYSFAPPSNTIQNTFSTGFSSNAKSQETVLMCRSFLLYQVNEGKIPTNRVALRMLAEEMINWPNVEVEAPKQKRSKSLYARATDTGVDPREAAKRLNIDWDSAAEIEDAEISNETEVPPAVGYGALYLVTAFPVIIGISVVLILFYNSLQ